MIKTLYLIVPFIFFLSTSVLSQYPNILIDNTGSPEEVTIAINPLNPDILAAGSNIDNFYRSTNGGLTWTESHLGFKSFRSMG